MEHIQKKPISIAHHLHVPALALRGVKKKIPVVVILRKPEEAIASLVIREKHIQIKQAIKAYIDFYEPLLRYKNEILFIDFHRAVEDFSSVISDINSKFDLKLDNYSSDNPIDNKVIFSKIEKINNLIKIN